MTVYDVMDQQIFNADERHKDGYLASVIDLDWAIKIHDEQQY